MSLNPPERGCAWITGASSGLGREVAIGLAQLGWKVAITARREEALQEVASTLGLEGRIFTYRGDVTDEAVMAQLVERIELEHGPIALAVLNAGTYKFESVDTINLKDLKTTLDTNLYGVLYGLVPVLERMKARKSGHVVLVSSVAGYSGLPGSLAYGASKAALLHLGEALYLEAASHGIKVQVMSPGFVETPLTAQNTFPMPFLMPVREAGVAILKGLASPKFEICFPWQLSRILKFMRILPYWAYFPIVRKMTGRR